MSQCIGSRRERPSAFRAAAIAGDGYAWRVDGLYRLIDANANRAREGLRVMEDLARFVLDDGPLVGDIKALRHALRDALDAIPGGQARMLASRDTPGDVGTSIKASGEGERSGVVDLASAAGKRVGEALRAIEEGAKALGADWAGVERLRYAHYDLERRLVMALSTHRAVGPQWRLCVLLTQSNTLHRWQDVARSAVRAGADCLQLREPDEPDLMLLSKAKELVELVAHETDRLSRPRSSVSVIINNRPDIALLSGADGVHLGQTDLPIESVREMVGRRLLIGASTHSLDEARQAVDAGADYCGVGAMFASRTKSRDLAGPEYLREYLSDPATSRVPHLAIGGVTPENVGQLVAVGCRGVAVSAAVLDAPDPELVCRQLIEALTARPAPAV
jgi:thiamine-phosphate pyrophosphorylase